MKELDNYVPLYERFKKFFGYLNTGHDWRNDEIFAYNGGLFAPDELLDNINIDDKLLNDGTRLLSSYDFESEVDVNILGHIFEHSLSEIEEVQAELAGNLIEKSKTKRKKDGVFYTPRYITKYIVENTVGTLCQQKKHELNIIEEDYIARKFKTSDAEEKRKKKLLATLDTYRSWLFQLTICDPACGSGAFLNQALEFLITEHRYIDELKAKLFGDLMVLSDVETTILENNLFGVDINEEAIEIARLSLWLRTARKGRKLNDLSKNIKCGNSLIDDPTVAGSLAFNWKEQFPQIFDKGGFDVIIGNPPYVFAREKITEQDKVYYNKFYESAHYQINTYLLFVERSNQIVKPKGQVGLIVPNAWLMVSSAMKLREYLLKNTSIQQIVNLFGYSFENVNVETIIVIYVKNVTSDNSIIIKENKGLDFIECNIKSQDSFLQEDGFEFKVFSNDQSESITQKIKLETDELDSIASVKAGLQAYEVGKGIPKQTRDDVTNRPYDYNFKFDDNTHKYLDGKDVSRYLVKWSGLYLKYGDHLAAPRTFDLFSGPKIIVREITGLLPRCIISTYSEEIYLFNRSNIAIVERPGSAYSLKYILAILNSSLMSYYFFKNTPKSVRQIFPKVILQDLKKFPIKKPTGDYEAQVVLEVDKLLSLNDQMFHITNQFIKLLESKYDNYVVSKKIASWHLLSFKEFS